MKRLSLMLSAVGLAVGCAVGPDYVPPESNPPAHFASQSTLDQLSENKSPSNQSPDQALAQLIGLKKNWWEGFNDPVLNQLIDTALNRNHTIAAAAARWKAAGAKVRLAGADDELNIDLQVDADVQGEQAFLQQEDASAGGNLSGALMLIWPLDIFGATQRRVEAAHAELAGAAAALRGRILAVSAETAQAYLRLRGHQRQLKMLEASVQLQQKTLAIVRSRYNAGLAPEFDLRRAEAQVASLQADIPPLRQSVINSRHAIAVLTGRFPGAYVKLLSAQQALPVYQAEIPRRLPLQVLSMRPDVRLAEARLKQAVAEIGVAEAQWYPTIQVVQEISVGAGGIGSTPTVGLVMGRIGALMEQVLSDGGRRQAGLEIARARAEEKLADYHETLLTAVQEVEITLSAIEASHNRRKALTRKINAGEKSFRQAGALYRRGLTSFLDVLVAQRELDLSRQQLAAAQTDYAVGIAELFRVLGTKIN